MDVAATDLPAYRALLVVDMKDFSGERGRDHAELTESIPAILRQAFRRCGLVELWEEALFQGSTGDGHFSGFTSRSLPHLLNPVLPALQTELDHRNETSGTTIRMRASVNVGPMTGEGENTISDGSGDARVETHRLLDSEPVRDLLERSGRATCVAAIVSARAFEDAVLSGYSAEDPELYVPAPVQVKSYQGTAYLRVPHPSGDLLRRGFSNDDAGSSGEEVAVREAGPWEPAGGHAARDVRGPVAQDGSRAGENVGDGSGNGNRNFWGNPNFGTYHEGSRSTRMQNSGDGGAQYAGDHHGDVRHTFHRGQRR